MSSSPSNVSREWSSAAGSYCLILIVTSHLQMRQCNFERAEGGCAPGLRMQTGPPALFKCIRAITEPRHARGGNLPSLVLLTKGVFPRCELRCEFCNESYAMSVPDLDIVIAHAEAAPRG